MGSPTIAFASHELWPFVAGGGIGRSVWAWATLMRDHADVTVITSSHHEAAFRALPADDPRALPGVRVVFAPEPAGDLAPLRSLQHGWSLALLDALRGAYGDAGPDLVVFNDYWGEGAMTAEARRSGEPFLRDTIVAVCTRTTHEMTAALNGGLLGTLERTLHGLERCSLLAADAVVWPGGDVLGTYRRFYGEDALAPGTLIPETFMPAPAQPADRELPPEDGLRLLYFGRLERRKGVEDLVEAIAGLEAGDLRLTLVGGDTETATGGGSMRTRLERLAGDDERISLRERVPHDELAGIIRAHHVVISPSRWESWSNVVREALAGNRPVLATPVGGVIDAIRPGRSGWLTGGTGPGALREAVEQLLGRREEIARLIAGGTPRACLEEMLGHDDIVRKTLALTATGSERRRPAAPIRQTVTALVTFDRAVYALERALASLRDGGVPVRVVLAGIGGMPPTRLGLAVADALLVDAARTPQEALRAALAHARGDALLLLDGRDELDPGFLPRALAALAGDPRLAYVSALPAGTDAPAPLPNAAAAALGEGVGSGPVLVRRADIEAVGLPERPHGDAVAAMAVALAARGRWGAVIPEPLVRRTVARAAPPADEFVPARTLPVAMWVAPAADL
jgi:glycosyltransferase involved in cell wall biosynthesis